MSLTVVPKIDWIVLAINTILIMVNAWNLRRIRRLRLELQASSEIERHFQAWRKSQVDRFIESEMKLAIPM